MTKSYSSAISVTPETRKNLRYLHLATGQEYKELIEVSVKEHLAKRAGEVRKLVEEVLNNVSAVKDTHSEPIDPPTDRRVMSVSQTPNDTDVQPKRRGRPPKQEISQPSHDYGVEDEDEGVDDLIRNSVNL